MSRGTIRLCVLIALGVLLGTLGILSLVGHEDRAVVTPTVVWADAR